MRNCKYEKQIDDYLLNRMEEGEKAEFEQHYFDCVSCFKEIVERDELIATVKLKADVIFGDMESVKDSHRLPWFERALSFLTIKQWATAAVSAALILIIALGVLPNLKKQPPQFYLNEDTVRGKSITIISDNIPSQFKWESLGEGIEYKISIYNHDLLWSKTIKENSISLPEEIKSKMVPGTKYFWQVKAFSPKGTLIAESSKIRLPVSIK
jgi:hypothetical protein